MAPLLKKGIIMNKYVLSLLGIFFTIYGYCHANDNTEKMLETEFTSFHQTKNPHHLKIILEYVKNQNDNVVFLAYEWKNREFLQEMTERLGKKLPESYSGDENLKQQIKNDKNYDKIVLTRWVMESLQSMQKNDPSIKEMGKDLVAKDPSLDYWKRIFNMVGYSYKGFNAF